MLKLCIYYFYCTATKRENPHPTINRSGRAKTPPITDIQSCFRLSFILMRIATTQV